MASELRKKLNNIAEDYQESLILAKSVGSTKVYNGTTATAGDILAGKTAYSNGSFVEGTLELKNTSIVNTTTAGKYVSTTEYTSTLYKKIKKIDGTLKVEGSCNGLFAGCEELEEAPNLDFSSVTTEASFDCMFLGCTKLTKVPVYNPPKKFGSGKCMFKNCISLTTIPAFDYYNLGNMYQMFYGCTNLVNLSRFYIAPGKVGNMQDAFTGCNNLSDASLNYILELIVRLESGFSSLPHGRTLKTIGLTAEQVERCKTQYYWAQFDALTNWGTGY
jgi:hypothetical protein